MVRRLRGADRIDGDVNVAIGAILEAAGYKYSDVIKSTCLLSDMNNFAAMNDKGSLVTGTVKSVEPKGAVIQLSEEVEGYLRASEISRDRVEDAGTHLKVGDTVEAMVLNIDRKARGIQLSIKAKDNVETQEAMQKMAATDNNAASGTTSLGALLKAKFDNKN